MRPSYPVPIWTMSGTQRRPDAWTEAFDFRFRLLVHYAENAQVDILRLTNPDRVLLRDWLEAVRDGYDEHPWRGDGRLAEYVPDVARSCLSGGTGDNDFRAESLAYGLVERAKEGVESPDLGVFMRNVLADEELARAGVSWVNRNRGRRRIDRILRRWLPDLYLDGDFDVITSAT